ncbi:hypothetical protein WJX72_011257 [[Myrmecia] bisecta]|uniref:Uncharacterized protein n=1 Tax=[Myrmecia] bisecta TaxID=41462 RepID=A0AAW1PYS8_9CHLO
MTTATPDTIKMPAGSLTEEVEAEILQLVLEAVYGQEYKVTEHQLEALLAASNYLQVGCVQSACCAYLREELQDDNCWQTLATAAHFGCEELCKQTLTYSQKRASKTHKALQALPKDTLVNVLQSKFGSESDAIQVALTWAATEVNSQLEHLSEVLAAMRLTCSTWAVSEVKRADEANVQHDALIASRCVALQLETMGALAAIGSNNLANQDAFHEAHGIPALVGQSSIIEAGGIPALVYTLINGSSAAQLQACALLIDLCEDVAETAGGISSIPAMQPPPHAGLPQDMQAAEAVPDECRTGNAANQDAIREAGAVAALLQLLLQDIPAVQPNTDKPLRVIINDMQTEPAAK